MLIDTETERRPQKRRVVRSGAEFRDGRRYIYDLQAFAATALRRYAWISYLIIEYV